VSERIGKTFALFIAADSGTSLFKGGYLRAYCTLFGESGGREMSSIQLFLHISRYPVQSTRDL
jgi:hypothetical protein